METLTWGGTWSFNTVVITGNQMFDYFFTLVSVMGLASFMVSALIKVLR